MDSNMMNPGWPALGLSLLSLFVSFWRTRNRLRTSLGTGDYGQGISVYVYNPTGQALQVIAVGMIQGDGSLSDWMDDGSMMSPRIVAPRTMEVIENPDLTFQLPTVFRRSSSKGYAGCYVRTADGKAHYSIRRPFRWWLLLRWRRERAAASAWLLDD
ncbi:hypothetical protein [Dyella ginsengisoli]|uniref:hypothetical protein n=1 Tax=Dyella ginsengisoli TaxID=363848 RepID=UPI0003732D27|nr:hypothetical protein [Dyella ginsengisoli]